MLLPMGKRTVFQIELSPELRDSFEAAAIHNGLNRAALVRRLMMDEVDRIRRQKRAKRINVKK